MKHMKKLGWFVVALAVSAAFAASASADELTGPGGTRYEGVLTAISEGGHVKLIGPLNVSIECEGHIEGVITSQGGEQQPVKGEVKSFKFTACTNGYLVTVLTTGVIEGEALEGGPDGTVSSTGAEITVHTPLGFNCLFKTNKTTIATATSSTTTTKTATLDMKGTIPRTGHSALCGTSGTLTGSGLVTEPDFLIADDK